MRIVMATINSITVKPFRGLLRSVRNPLWDWAAAGQTALCVVLVVLQEAVRTSLILVLWTSALVHRHDRLRSACRDVLHAAVFQRGAINAQRRLAGRLRLERQGKHLSVGSDAIAPRGTGSGDLQNPHHAVVAVNQGDRLTVLLQQRTVRNVQQLQDLRVIQNLQGTEYTFCPPV